MVRLMAIQGSGRYRAALPLAGIFLAIAALGIAFGYIALELEWGGELSVESVKTAVVGLGPWGMLASIGLMVVHSFLPFPAEVVAIANGMLYGPVWGTAITWIGAMLGALVAFGLTRLLGRPFVVRVISEHDLRRLDDWADRNGARVILIARLIPAIAFNLINYAAGLTRVSWWAFGWSTGLGILPLTVLMVAIGDRIEAVGWEFWLALLVGGAIIWLLFRRRLGRRGSGAGPSGGGRSARESNHPAG